MSRSKLALYCNRHCVLVLGLPSLHGPTAPGLPLDGPGVRGGAEGAGGDPRGGCEPAGGVRNKDGAPVHARFSENLAPPAPPAVLCATCSAQIFRESKPVAPSPDWLLRCKVADLVHLLQFATITTPSEGDAGQARRILADLRGML